MRASRAALPAWRLLLCALCMAVVAVVQAQPAPPPRSQWPPAAITVVLDDNYPPYVFRDATGQLQGILKDSWALWQQRTGVTVQLQAMDVGKLDSQGQIALLVGFFGPFPELRA